MCQTPCDAQVQISESQVRRRQNQPSQRSVTPSRHRRPRPTGLAFLAGWLIGLAALTVVFVEVSDLFGDLSKPPGWASWLRIVIGVALIVFGVFRWLTRKRSAHTPAWMQRLSKLTPMRAGLAALALTVVNPKVLFICAAAGLAGGAKRGPIR